MKSPNIFDGERAYAEFARLAYKRILSREWFSYADLMVERLNLSSVEELPYKLSSCDKYGELKKAFRDIRKAINDRVGFDCFEEKGNNRDKSFRYIGEDDDPLADMKKARVIDNLKQYWQFCQDSAGFFPIAWLEYFFKDCWDLLDIKKKRNSGEQVLSASLDRMLTNIDLLPSLYVAIINKQVLSIDYKPYVEDERTLIFHPHYLKEYNGRWHLFGHAEDQMPEYGYNIALDRIVRKPREVYKHDYIAAPKGYYKEFFRDKVGVSHLPDAEVKEIHVRAHNINVYKLTETKVIHHSQETVIPYGEHEDGEYGEFSLRVEVNNEFIGRILQMGAGLEIVSPDDVRDLFKQRVKELAKLYE